MVVLCTQCGSGNTDRDHLVVDNVEYPCWICLDCGWIWRREKTINEKN